MIDTKFPPHLEIKNDGSLFPVLSDISHNDSVSYISLAEHQHAIAEARAEIWHQAAGLYSTHHHTDKHPMDSDFAVNCMKIAAEIRNINKKENE